MCVDRQPVVPHNTAARLFSEDPPAINHYHPVHVSIPSFRSVDRRLGSHSAPIRMYILFHFGAFDVVILRKNAIDSI